MKNKINLNVVIGLCFLCIWLIPMVQTYVRISVEELGGAIIKEKQDTTLTIDNWMSGVYAEKKQNYLTESFGFRESFIRLRNQIKYTFFKQTCVNDVIVGKDDNLFELKYIRSYIGLDYMGQTFFEDKVKKIQFVQDTLKKLNKTLIILLAPGKASIYKEYIPDNYDKNNNLNNYSAIKAALIKNKINNIDYKLMFERLKPKTEHRLFTKGGTHWSTYSMGFVLDSLLRYIEKKTNYILPGLDYNNIIYSNQAVRTDDDIKKALNMIFYPDYGKYACIDIKVINKANMNKIKVLAVGDSFWECLYNTPATREVFSEQTFFTYNCNIQSYNKVNEGKHPADIDLLKEINKNDVICILATEANIKNIGWEFIEECYDLFKGKSRDVAERKKQNRIGLIWGSLWDDAGSYNSIRIQSLRENIPMDSVVTRIAKAMY